MTALILLVMAVACDSPFITDSLTSGPGNNPAPQSVVAAVKVLPAGSGIVIVGTREQLSATVRDASGNVIQDAAVSWSTNAPEVATVSSTGVLDAAKVGNVVVVATSGGKADSLSVEIVAGSQPPTKTTHIPLTLERFRGASGDVLVSNAIPLPPGLLTPSNTKYLRLTVGGVEQSLYVEPLAGLHADGSLRSVLIQFHTALDSSRITTGELIVGQQRQVADLAKPEAGRSLPAAVALPSDPHYLVSTDLVGPTLSFDSTDALGGQFSRYDQDFAKYADYHWNLEGDAWENNYYDRALIYYAFWVRTGNVEYWRRGTRFAVSYRVNYVEPSHYGPSAHWSLMEGLATHYLLTGDDSSRHAVGQVASQTMDAPYLWSNLPQADTRILARMLSSFLLAWRINADGQAAYFAQRMELLLPKILELQQADGSFRFPVFCNQNANYMSGMLNDVLIQYYSYYSQDSRIVPSIKRSTDFLWNTQWIPASQAFKYLSGSCVNVGGEEQAGDLNNMIVNGFAWLYKQTGDPSYRQKADEIFIGAQVNNFFAGTKQFNESFATSYRYLAYRR